MVQRDSDFDRNIGSAPTVSAHSTSAQIARAPAERCSLDMIYLHGNCEHGICKLRLEPSKRLRCRAGLNRAARGVLGTMARAHERAVLKTGHFARLVRADSCHRVERVLGRSHHEKGAGARGGVKERRPPTAASGELASTLTVITPLATVPLMVLS